MKPWIPAAAILSISISLGLAAAPFGTPLICQEYAIGNARSLPWEEGKTPNAGYDRARLANDFAEILKTEEDPVVRLETLRRAALYARSDRALAWELVGRTGLAVLDQSAIGAKESARWMDAGVLVACFDQLGLDLGCRAGVGEGFAGYGYLMKALEAARSEKSESIAAIEFAAALVSHPMMKHGSDAKDYERYQKHMDAARTGARAGSLLAKNVAVFEERFRPQAPGHKTGISNGQ